MHFISLVTVEIPEITENQAKNQEIENCLKELRESYKQDSKNIVLELQIERLLGLATKFARTVDYEVGEIMEPYNICTEDPKYLEFDDRTEELKNEYFQGTSDCIRLPNGSILEVNSYPIRNRFVISDGKVFQTHAGPLHHMKRTKKAKKMTALPAYPYTKFFKTFAAYAEDRGASFNKQKERYGCWYNQNGMWDGYSIGGRWPDMFLVKDTCKEVSTGDRSWWNSEKEYEVPEGYMWVCAARKKDIDWRKMREWNIKKIMERYEKLQQMFEAGKMDDVYCGNINDKGIFNFGECIYSKDDSVEEFIQRHRMPTEWKYPIYNYDIVDKYGWRSVDDFRNCAEQQKSWHTILDEYIDSLSDDMVLVGVDCHI